MSFKPINVVYFSLTDASVAFTFNLKHSNMDDTLPVKNNYQLGDNIKFTMHMESTRPVKGVIQECTATSNGTADSYKLITNR